MTSWADASDDSPSDYNTGTSTGGGRPRLQLKPRSAKAAQDASAAGGGGSSIFGAAKPREQVLAAKGVDASEVDKRVERKASVARLTADQDKQVEALRKELTGVEEKLREANEMELPEEDYRVDAEKKRNELNELIKGFHEANLKDPPPPSNSKEGPSDAPDAGASAAWGGKGGGSSSNGDGGSQRKFERPSERRRRLEQKNREREGGGYNNGYDNGYNNNRGSSRGGGGYNDYDEEGEDAFKSFGGNNRRGGNRGGGGGSYNNSRGGSYNNDRGGSYNDRGGSRNGGYNDDKYAGDRYNY